MESEKAKHLLEIPSCEAVERDMIKHMYSSTIIKPETTSKKKLKKKTEPSFVKNKANMRNFFSPFENKYRALKWKCREKWEWMREIREKH